MAEKIVIVIFIISHLFSGLYMIINKKYTGEAKSISNLFIDRLPLFGMLLILILGYCFLYIFYNSTKKNKPKISFIPSKIIVNKIKAHQFVFVLLVAQLIFSNITGVGKVGSTSTSSLSFIFSFLKVESLFLFYYILCRERKKLYVVNSVLFFLYRLSLGWTWFIFQYSIIELFLYFKNKKNKSFISNFKLIIYPSVLLIVGAKAYQYFYQIKFYIRLDTWNYKLNYFDSLSALINRFSFFPIAVSVIQNLEKIKVLYNYEGPIFKDVISIFRPLLPGFIMQTKQFRTLNNIFIQAIHPEIGITTSSNAGLFSYGIALFYSDFLGGLFWMILTIFLFIIVSSIIKSLEEFTGQLDIIYFFLLFDIYNVSSLEQVFAYGYLSLFYLAPILWIFKVINIRIRR